MNSYQFVENVFQVQVKKEPGTEDCAPRNLPTELPALPTLPESSVLSDQPDVKPRVHPGTSVVKGKHRSILMLLFL